MSDAPLTGPTRSPVVWDQPAPTRRAPAVALSRDRIVAAAIVLADAEGLAALSMRKIGAKLGATAMSLYRHVPSKEDLIQLMLDDILGGQDLTGLPSGDWRADLTTLARGERARGLRHPWSVASSPRPSLGPNALVLFETELSVFNDLDLGISLRGWLANTVTSFVRGLVEEELAEHEEQRRSGLSTEEWQDAMRPYVSRIVASGDFPLFARFIREGEEMDQARDFELGLSCLLDGLERLVQGELSLPPEAAEALGER